MKYGKRSRNRWWCNCLWLIQGFDQDYLIHALKSLKGLFVATTQLPVETSDEKIIKLNELGVRGVRFNVKEEVRKI